MRPNYGNIPELYIEVSYFNALEGGSGSTRMRLSALLKWLKDHPGHLIRAISDLNSFD